jgi:hypothetical protein
MTDFGGFPIGVRPQCGPEGRFTAQKHYLRNIEYFPRNSNILRLRRPPHLADRVLNMKDWFCGLDRGAVEVTLNSKSRTFTLCYTLPVSAKYMPIKTL